MENLKIIPLIISFCITLNLTGTAIEPYVEKELQGMITTHAQQAKKAIKSSLELFRICLCGHNHEFDCDSTINITRYLIYYVYTLYPLTISAAERIQLSVFFEQCYNRYGLPPYLKEEFYNALNNVPAKYNRLEPNIFIQMYEQEILDPKNRRCDQICSLIKSFTNFVYTLYAIPLDDSDRLMLYRTYDEFKLLKPLEEDLLALKKAIDNLPEVHS